MTSSLSKSATLPTSAKESKLTEPELTSDTGNSITKSSFYIGEMSHHRFRPREHRFNYQVMMCYLNLDDIDATLKQHKLWGTKWYHLARYQRTDYFGDPNIPLNEAVRTHVNDQLKKNELDQIVDGPICMLTNVRLFGFTFNPITIYYCYNKAEQLQALLLEVTNTPWQERQTYLLPCDPEQSVQRNTFNKQMHVSPFMPMHQFYQFNNNCPNEFLTVYMRNMQTINQSDVAIFGAGLRLKHSAMNQRMMSSVLWRFPLMTFKVVAAIHWQALKLFLKRVPLFAHPKNNIKKA